MTTNIVTFLQKFKNATEKSRFLPVYHNHLLSTGKCKICDLPEENILWAVEIQFFTRSSIDFILNFAD